MSSSKTADLGEQLARRWAGAYHPSYLWTMQNAKAGHLMVIGGVEFIKQVDGRWQRRESDGSNLTRSDR